MNGPLIAPFVVARLSGFAFERLDALRFSASAEIAQKLLRAEDSYRAIGAKIDRALDIRYLDHPGFQDPATRNIRRRRVKRTREAARHRPEELPRTALEETARIFPELETSLAELEQADREVRVVEELLRATFAGEIEEKSGRLRAIYREDDRLREAVLMESPSAHAAIEHLISKPGPRNAHTRIRERMAARYLQRFLAKNDTHSMCGPDSVVPLVAAGDIPRLIVEEEFAARRTYFTHWAACALYESFGMRLGRERTLLLRRNPSLRVEGGKISWCVFEHDATSYFRRRYARMSSPETIALLGLLGTTPRAPAELIAGCEVFMRAEKAHVLIEKLIQVGVIVGEYSLPADAFDPLPVLIGLIERWPIGQAREEALQQIGVIQGLVRKFDGAALSGRVEVLSELAMEFESATGTASLRGGGKHYADRMLIHEECHARVEVDLGASVLAQLRGALGPLVHATSLPNELARENVRCWFRDRFGENRAIPVLEAHRAFDEDVACMRPSTSARADALRAGIERIQSLFGRAIAAAHGGVASIDPQELEREAARATGGMRDGYISIDLLLGRRTPDLPPVAVLGELHGIYWFPTASLDVASGELREATLQQMRQILSRLAGGRKTAELLFKHTQFTDCRHPITDAELVMIGPPARKESIEIGDLQVMLAGDHFLFTTSAGEEIVPIVTYGTYPFFSYLSAVAPLHNEFTGRFFPRELLPPAYRDGDTPRLELGGLIFRRRTWVRSARELATLLGRPADEQELYLRAQRLRVALGCDRFVFASIAGEPKPVLIDFDNFFLIESFYRMLAHAAPDSAVRISEMLPGPDQLLMEAKDGRRTSELRIGVHWIKG